MYRNRWTVCHEPMPKRQSEDEFVSVYTPPPLADGRTGSRNRARRGGLTTIHYRDGCPETVQSLYYSLRIAPSFRSMSTCVPIQCTRSAKTCTRDSAYELPLYAPATSSGCCICIQFRYELRQNDDAVM